MSQTDTSGKVFSFNRGLQLVSGPILAVITYYLFTFKGADESVCRMGAIAGWMAAWWILEAIPLAATALLPVVFYPLLGIMGTKEIAPAYMNHVLFLFIGGFIIAYAMERWNLHKRIALRIMLLIGTGSSRLLLGIMAASFFLSMWISNTATTMMMIPTTLAVIDKISGLCIDEKSRSDLSIGLLLGLAYAASIGGTATLVGTPPNLIFLGIYADQFPDLALPSFLQWMMLGVPIALAMFLAAYLIIRKMYFKPGKIQDADIHVFRDELNALGKVSFEEKVVAADFTILALLWIFRSNIDFGAFTLPGWSSLFDNPDRFQDSTVAILMATILFIIPSKQAPGEPIITWEMVRRMPYGIILLFGGGFALAQGFVTSGLTDWLGNQLEFFTDLHIIILILAIAGFMTFLTEMTSNMATTQLILPILGAIAGSSDMDPLLLMLPATFSASFAFMLPVATAPNMIVFGTEKIPIRSMIFAGLRLNLAGIAIITVLMLVLGRWVY